MRYWFLPLIFALCASAHFHDKPHDTHPNKVPECAKDEIRGRDGKCQKCLPGQILNSSGVCMCEPGSTLINGQCVFPPCPTGQIRINTHCVNPCPEGQIFTNDRCVIQECLPNQIRVSSGACICEPGSTLINGQCVFPPCPEGQIRVNTHCFPICPEGHVFSNGQCVSAPDTKKAPGGEPKCQPCPTPCSGGQVLENDKCVCPHGQVMNGTTCACPGGTKYSSTTRLCEKIPQPETDHTPPKGGCPSGVQTGKLAKNRICKAALY